MLEIEFVQEVISNHFNPEVTEEVTTEPEGEEADVADPEGPRFHGRQRSQKWLKLLKQLKKA